MNAKSKCGVYPYPYLLSLSVIRSKTAYRVKVKNLNPRKLRSAISTISQANYQLRVLTQDEAALEDARDWESHEESEEDEHDVVDGEGADDASDDLDHARHQHYRPAPESAQR